MIYSQSKAFMEIVDLYNVKQTIFIVDRGFERTNIFKCLKRKTKCPARIKDINCKT